MPGPMRKKGDFAENIGLQYLKNNGFVILEKNYLIRAGEIDIICAKDDSIHFVEIKSSFTNYRGVENLTKKKLRNMFYAANVYFLKNKIKNKQMRFDLIEVSLVNREVDIIYYPDINVDYVTF